MLSGPLVKAARSAIFRIAVCQPASAWSSSFSVAFRSLTTSGATRCSTRVLITPTSASVRPLKNGGAPRIAGATLGSVARVARKSMGGDRLTSLSERVHTLRVGMALSRVRDPPRQRHRCRRHLGYDRRNTIAAHSSLCSRTRPMVSDAKPSKGEA